MQIPPKILNQCADVESSAYVYDVAKLVDTIQTMANPLPKILQVTAAHGLGACVNSINHLEAAQRAGVPATRIQFTASGVPERDMIAVASADVRCNLDSPLQVERYLSRSGARECGIRLNVRSMMGGSYESQDRLGVDVGALPALVDAARQLGGRIVGAHVYVGTNFLSYADMIPTLTAFFAACESIPDLDYVNLGGGMGVDYAGRNSLFDLDAFSQTVRSSLATLAAKKGRAIQLYIEPGRSLVSSCGYFASRVTDIKELGTKRFIVLDSTVAQFPRPWHHPDSPHRAVAVNVPGDDICDSVLVGRTTYSNDILGRQPLPRGLAVGDVVVFLEAGAYCDSMRSTFLGQSDPAQILVN
jgi:diaminopimelate decarboxylase